MIVNSFFKRILSYVFFKKLLCLADCQILLPFQFLLKDTQIKILHFISAENQPLIIGISIFYKKSGQKLPLIQIDIVIFHKIIIITVKLYPGI